MAKIILIACASKKCCERSKARDLYMSALFKKSLAYALRQQPDKIFILSAEHGLLHLDDIIEPYNKTLNKMSQAERRAWGEKVKNQLAAVTDLAHDTFIFLAGENYRAHLTPHMQNSKTPMAGKRIGEQLQWLGQQLG